MMVCETDYTYIGIYSTELSIFTLSLLELVGNDLLRNSGKDRKMLPGEFVSTDRTHLYWWFLE